MHRIPTIELEIERTTKKCFPSENLHSALSLFSGKISKSKMCLDTAFKQGAED